MPHYTPPPHYYTAYIDEAGDPGISRVRPLDKVGGTEWLVIGGVLIEATREPEPANWVRSMLDDAGLQHTPVLHFRELADWRKPTICQHLARRPVVLFAMLSNKKNMRGHTNPRAAAKGNPLTPRQWFYNYCLRLILERITDFCLSHSLKHYGAPRHVKVIFSERGGHSYSHNAAYHELLKVQSRAGTTVLQKRTIKSEVVDRRLLEAVPHEMDPGLQLADIVASSFYQAIDILPPTHWNPDNAKLLKPRIATEAGFYRDYGVIFQPTPYSVAKLKPKQKLIFEFYDFDGRDF
jgi:hypothetical protein